MHARPLSQPATQFLKVTSGSAVASGCSGKESLSCERIIAIQLVGLPRPAGLAMTMRMSKDHLYRRGVGIMLLNAEGRCGSARGSIIPTTPGRCRRAGWTRARSRGRPRCASWRKRPAFAPHLVERIVRMPGAAALRSARGICGANYGAASGSARTRTGICAASSAATATSTSPPTHPEFREWRWIEPARLPDLIVPFKRDLYRRLIAEFADFL